MTPPLAPLLRHLRRLASGPHETPESDAALLQRFVRERDDNAFAALLARHGAMVLAVCCRVLRDRHEAEDVFQSVFLALAQQAGALRHPDRLASWLYVTARHLALKAHRAAIRRRQRECRYPPSDRTSSADPLDELSAREMLNVLDEEIHRLPEVYRLPLVLCCLEGRPQDEAARLLGWSAGSVRGRLERGRARLHTRLLRRGLSLSAALLMMEAMRGEARIPPLDSARTILQAARTLAETGSRPLAAFKLKWMLALSLTAGMAAAGVGVLIQQPAQPMPPSATAEPPIPRADEQVRTDRHGDPLPPGALVRLGTVRLRHNAFQFAFAPDGRRIASAGSDGCVRIWNPATGAEVGRLGGHRGAVYAIAYSPDGNQIATGDVRDIHLWDTATGRKIRTLPGFDGGKDFDKRQGMIVGIFNLAFSPDGKVLAVSEGNVRVSLWDVASGERRGQLEASGMDALAFLPDGQRVLSAAGGVVRLCDLSGKELRKLETASSSNRLPLALTSDGKRFVAAEERPITRSDGNIRYVIRFEGVVTLWDFAAGKERRRLDVPRPVRAVALSPDGKTLAFSQDRAIHLHDVASWKEARRIDLDEGMVFHLVFSPDGKTLASSGRNDIQLWDTATGRPLVQRAGHAAVVDVLAFTAGGRQLVSTCRETGVARVWDAATGRQLHHFAGDWHHGVTALSMDGRMLLSSGTFNSIQLWDVAAGRRVRSFQIEKAPASEYSHDLRALALTADGRRVVSISKNNTGDRMRTILVQDAATGKEYIRLTEAAGDKRGGNDYLRLSRDGRCMVQTDGHTIRVRAVDTGAILRSLHPDKLQPEETLAAPIVFSDDGRFLAYVAPIQRRGSPRITASRIHVWELATAREIACFAAPGVTVIAFSPDGRLLAAAEEGNEIPTREAPIFLWDVVTGVEVGRLQGHGTFVSSLAYSCDGRRIATGLANSTILIWNLDPVRRRLRQSLPAVRAEALPRLWSELAGPDARKAQASIRALAAAPALALPFLQKQLFPARSVDPEQLRRLIADLESETFVVRENAMKELRQLDRLAEAALCQARAGKPSLECRRRIEELLAEYRGPATSAEACRMVRAVAVLEYVDSPETRRFLAKLAEGASEARLTREAKMALGRLPPR